MERPEGGRGESGGGALFSCRCTQMHAHSSACAPTQRAHIGTLVSVPTISKGRLQRVGVGLGCCGGLAQARHKPPPAHPTSLPVPHHHTSIASPPHTPPSPPHLHCLTKTHPSLTTTPSFPPPRHLHKRTHARAHAHTHPLSHTLEQSLQNVGMGGPGAAPPGVIPGSGQ